MSCMLPIMYVDSFPIVGDYLRSMFVAVSQDGNREELVIPFVVRFTKNVDPWTWFLRSIKECVRDVRSFQEYRPLWSFLLCRCSWVVRKYDRFVAVPSSWRRNRSTCSLRSFLVIGILHRSFQESGPGRRP